MALIHWNKPSSNTIHRAKGAPIVLLPGLNPLDKDDWDSIKDHPLIKAHMDEGNLLVSNESSSARQSVPDSLAGLGLKETLTLIDGMTDTNMLKKWLGKETRKNVQKVLAKQVKKAEALDKELAGGGDTEEKEDETDKGDEE